MTTIPAGAHRVTLVTRIYGDDRRVWGLMEGELVPLPPTVFQAGFVDWLLGELRPPEGVSVLHVDAVSMVPIDMDGDVAEQADAGAASATTTHPQPASPEVLALVEAALR